jgi:hypothetical protein
MTTKTCGCSTETCGCCEGTEKLTPAPIENRPALPALSYRVGTHGAFFSTMKARLSTMEVNAPGGDGQTLETFRPLTGLTTRETSDPAIALLDGWATVADVLTFYQERIANEGYLRTATERRSVLELARLLGYELRPGVASSVYLAYTLDEKQTESVEIPVGARTQSVPGPGELPQTFETSEKIIARSQWNNLQVRLTRPPEITLENILSLDVFYVAGLTANLKAGDLLLFVFGALPNQKAVRTVAEAKAQTDADRILVRLAPLPVGTVEALPLLDKLIQQLRTITTPDLPVEGIRLLEELRMNTFLGLAKSPLDWPATLSDVYQGEPPPKEVEPFANSFAAGVAEVVAKAGAVAPATTTCPDEFVAKLLEEPRVQAANSLNLARTAESELRPGADAYAQLLVNFAPKLKDSYYTAWSSANVNPALPTLQGVFVLRLKASVFGANAPKRVTYSNGIPTDPVELDLAIDETKDSVFLEQAFESVSPNSFALIDVPLVAELRFKRLSVSVTSVTTGQRSAYEINGKSTRLKFAEAWREVRDDHGALLKLGAYRETLVYAQSEPLVVAPSPMSEDVCGGEVELAALYDGLVSGRWIILSGERADIPNVAGVQTSELLMISGLRQDFFSKLADCAAPTALPKSAPQSAIPDGLAHGTGADGAYNTQPEISTHKAIPGDKTHTTLLLAKPTAYRYKRESVKIFANVVKATHGETRNEVLGSGDGARALQTFTLKQPPLTFVPAPTPDGVETTLKVYVNDVQWHEAETLAGLGANDRNFITKTDDDTATTLIFGNGKDGSRLPTGVENVRAVYRNGIGKAGNVKADQISLLQTKPLGVKSVTNPLRASGGADKESRDQARENAPLRVAALDRLVGVQDYTDFTRTFACIAKAHARKLSDGRRQLVHITIAGADDVPIDGDSDTFRNLVAALRKYGDEALPVQIEPRELVVLVLSAKVRIAPDYLWDKVAEKIRATVAEAFGFAKRALGQPALLCEIMSVIQNVEGVAYVDVDAFGGLPEKKPETDSKNAPTGKRRLLTLTELAAQVRAMIDLSRGGDQTPPAPADRVDVNLADFENGSLRPAQLAIFTPAVPDTLILNQIL